MSQSFDIQSIFTRAAELGIELALDGENSIAVSAAPGVVTAQILDVLRAHKQDLIEYLQSLATTPENAPPDKDLTAQAGDIDVTPRAEACAICGGPLHRVCSVGVGYCANHWPYAGDEPIREGSQCCKCGAPARHASPSGYQYCTEHYQCVRGHALRWRRHEESASWRCACFWEHTNEPGMTRAEYQRLVRKIIELFPGKHAQPASYEQL
ncbi:MAG: hypothetical protein J2P36_36315, partial [Ktedonobacteraceae bacterium]|nr:hypothetical protein [Ktedonobacteraceae bacterium]